MEETCKDFMITMITTAGSEERAKAAAEGMGIRGPADFATYMDKVLCVERKQRCEGCFRSALPGEKIASCQRCQKNDIEHR